MTRKKEVARMGKLRLQAICSVLLLVGCGTELKVIAQVQNATAQTVIGGYRSLNVADSAKIEQLKEQARSGDTEGAQAAMNEYVAARTKALKALGAASHLLEAFDQTKQVVIAAKQNPSALMDWLPKLTAAALEVKAALQALGVTL